MHKLILAAVFALLLSAAPALAIDPPKPLQPQTATQSPPTPKPKQSQPALLGGTYFLSNTDDFATYSDVADVSRPNANTRMIWLDQVYKSEVSTSRGKKKYSRELWSVACSSKMIGLLQATDYSTNGNVVGGNSFPLSYSYAVPNSVGSMTVSFACDPATEVRSKNAFRIPKGVSTIDYTDYVIFGEDKPKNCFTSAKRLIAVGLQELGEKAMANCLSKPTDDNRNRSSQEDPKGLY